MKKLLWSLLILLVLFGLFALWIIVSQRRLNVNTGNLGRLTQQTVTLQSTPQKIRLDIRTARLVIKPGNHCQLSTNNVINNQFKINNSDHQLTLTEAHAAQHQFEIGKTPVITLTVPTKIQQLTVNQLNGTLILNDLTVDSLEINHHNGTTTANNLTLRDSGQLTKENGKTDLRNLTSDGLAVSVKTGQFKLNGTKRAGSKQRYRQPGDHPLTITSGSGQVSVTTKA